MLDKDGYAKITDFGLSKEEISGNTGAYSFCGTPEYLAPEILAKTGHGKGVDWWSLGALVYEMITGLPPFYTKDRERLFNNIQYGSIEYKDFMSPAVRNLLEGLFVKDPQLRLGSGPNGSEDVKRHPWFHDIDWNALLKREVRPPFIPTIAGSNNLPISNFEREFTVQPANDSAGREPKLASSPTYDGFSFKAGGFIDELMEDSNN